MADEQAQQAREVIARWFITKHPELARPGHETGISLGDEIAGYLIALLWSGVGAARYVAICAHYNMGPLDGLDLLEASSPWTADVKPRIEQAAREVEGILYDSYEMSHGDPQTSVGILRMLWLIFYGDRNEIKSARPEDRGELVRFVNRMHSGLVHMNPLAQEELSEFSAALAGLGV